MPTRKGARPARAASAATSSGNRHLTLAALAQEIDDLLHRRLIPKGARDVLDPLPERPLRREQHFVGATQLVQRLVREAAPLQPNDVETREQGAVA